MNSLEPSRLKGVYLTMLTFAASALLALGAAALQAGTDFTGRWVLRSPAVAAEAAPVLVVEQPIATRNVRGEPMPPAYVQISIRRERGLDVITETYRIGVLGGSVGGLAGSGGCVPRTHHETVWEGDTLIFSGGIHTGDSWRTGEWTERREAWSLARDGTLLIEITIEGSATLRQTQRFIYARQ